MRRGLLYLVAVMDWASRKVLSWRVSNTMDADFCIEALEEALDRFGRPEIFNTDQGGAAQGSTCAAGGMAAEVASSPHHGLQVFCGRRVCVFPWMGGVAGWITSSLSGCGAA